jgi:predicted amidohydrolase
MSRIFFSRLDSLSQSSLHQPAKSVGLSMRSKSLVLFCLSLFFAASTWAAETSWTLEGWNPYAQRPALMQDMTKDETAGVLNQSSRGFHGNSAWRKTFPVAGETYYQFRAVGHATDVDLPRRSIVAKVDWKNRAGQRISWPDYPLSQAGSTDGGFELGGIYQAPRGAVSATIDLIFRWAERGSVQWQGVSFEPCEAPKPRSVKIATVNFRPSNSSGPEKNRQSFLPYLEQAGKESADIVCLGEGITVVGTSLQYTDVSESVPGATTRFLGVAAKQYNMYVVAGIYERAGETVYNTAVLIGRDGNLKGVYRKAALPREEIEGGITPGGEFPVFETDFGKVGIMICWDVQFPEPARRLAMNGAEIILMPIWGGNETLMAARAIENQVYLVTSGYDAPTAVFDRTGRRVAEATGNGTIAFHSVDLNKRTFWEWLGDLGARIPREAPAILPEPGLRQTGSSRVGDWRVR